MQVRRGLVILFAEPIYRFKVGDQHDDLKSELNQ